MRTRIIAALGSLCVAAFSMAASSQKTLAELVISGPREAVLAAIASPDIDVNAATSDGTTALIAATYIRDYELARALLKAGAKVNVTDKGGSNPLTLAVESGEINLVRLLLDAGADVDSPNQANVTALMRASGSPPINPVYAMRSLKIAELLIDHGAKLNAVDMHGETALMGATQRNHPEMVDLLIAGGADVKAKRHDLPHDVSRGFTALLYATDSGCYRCAVAIINAGADVNQPNSDGITPLINGLDNQRFDIAMLLLDRGANPRASDRYGRTPLYVAVDMNSFSYRGLGGSVAPPPPSAIKAIDVVYRLLSMGVDPNHQLTPMRLDSNDEIRFKNSSRFAEYIMRAGTTPLMIATLNYDDEAIKMLLAQGAAKVDLPNLFQITPLMAAAGMRGSGRSSDDPDEQGDVQARAIKTIDVLLDGGANINARVTFSDTRATKLVASVQGRDHQGKTALFAAAESGWSRVVKHLINRGADPTVRDASGKMALDYARSPVQNGPRAAARDGVSANADRAATVALLEALMPKSSGAGGDGTPPK